MREIKRRRLEEIVVSCHPATKVGQYVPFYFCPRSVILYLLHRGNHRNVDYTGGQRPIVHLEADLHETVAWAEAEGKRWAFSNSNAGARYARFFSDVARLDLLDWEAIGQHDFRDPLVKEAKQAEFLVEERFPWRLVRRIGVIDGQVAERVRHTIGDAAHHPEVVVARIWHF